MSEVAHKIDHMEKVAASFVCQFYSELVNAPEALASWYGKDSFLSYGEVSCGDEFVPSPQVLGGEHITDRLKRFAEETRGSTIKVLQVENQLTGSATMVSVWGVLSSPASKRHFYHVVVLAPVDEESAQSPFYVRNEVFRFLPSVSNVVEPEPAAVSHVHVEHAVAAVPSAASVPEPVVEHQPVHVPAEEPVAAPVVEQPVEESHATVKKEKKSRNKGKQPPQHTEAAPVERSVTPPAVETPQPAAIEEEPKPNGTQHEVHVVAHEEPQKPAAKVVGSYAAIALAAKDKRPVLTQPTRVGGGASEPEPEVAPAASTGKPQRSQPPACVVVLKKFPRAPTDDEIRAAIGKLASKCTRLDNFVESKGVAFLEFSVADALDVLTRTGVLIDELPITVEARKPRN